MRPAKSKTWLNLENLTFLSFFSIGRTERTAHLSRDRFAKFAAPAVGNASEVFSGLREIWFVGLSVTAVAVNAVDRDQVADRRREGGRDVTRTPRTQRRRASQRILSFAPRRP